MRMNRSLSWFWCFQVFVKLLDVCVCVSWTSAWITPVCVCLLYVCLFSTLLPTKALNSWTHRRNSVPQRQIVYARAHAWEGVWCWSEGWNQISLLLLLNNTWKVVVRNVEQTKPVTPRLLWMLVTFYYCLNVDFRFKGAC